VADLRESTERPDCIWGQRTQVRERTALLDQLFSQPVVSAKLVERLLRVSQPTASGLVNALADAGLLLFAYREYLELFPGAGLRS